MNRGTRVSLRRLGAVLAAGSLLLAGCSTIPSAGGVQQGLDDLRQDEPYQGQYNPQRPVAGASQADIVNGFLLAGTANADDYSVAREFLTAEYADQWDPDSGVLIDDGSRPFRSEGEAAGVVSITAIEKIDSQGLMLPAEPDKSTELRFEFERVGTEWRISSAPNGIVLDSATFQTIWSPHQLAFVGANRTLVPETRWYLVRAATATEVVSALIEGPSERMRESVRTAFPAGTELVNGTVPVVDGRAQIDLTGEALKAGPAAMAEIRQQLKTSLQNVRTVNGFDLSVEGTIVRDVSSDPGSEPHLVTEITNPAIVVDGRFGSLVAGEFTELPDPLGDLGAHPAKAITLARDESFAAVLDGTGVTLVDENGAVVIDDRPGLLAPTIDGLGYTWTAQSNTAQTIQIVATDGTVSSVSAPWLASRKTIAIRVSPDGSRLAALVADDGRSEVLVGGIVRDELGAPIRTSPEADSQVWAKGAPIDFDWIGSTRFAVLNGPSATPKVLIGGPGQLPAEQGSVAGGTEVSGGGTRAQLRVLGQSGELYSPLGSTWQKAREEVQLLAKRG